MPLRHFAKLIQDDYHKALIILGSVVIVVMTFLVGGSIAGSYALTVSYVRHVNALSFAQYRACLASNDAREAQIKLWDHVLAVSAKEPQNQSPRQREVSAQFRQYVHHVFMPRDCQKIPH